MYSTSSAADFSLRPRALYRTYITYNNISYTRPRVYRIGRGGLDARACRPLFFFHATIFILFLFFSPTCVLFAARSFGNRCNNKYPLCGCHTIYSRAAHHSPRARGNSFNALPPPPPPPYIIARALYAGTHTHARVIYAYRRVLHPIENLPPRQWART